MDEILRVMTSGFWQFIAVWIIITSVCNLLFRTWNRFMRMINMRKNGYPPIHCDADGDLIINKEEDE